MLTAILFLAITFTGFYLALKKGPIWGAVVYVHVYFMPPVIATNWWAAYIPDLKWGFLVPGIWLASIILHRDKLSKHKFSTAYWVFLFCAYTLLLTIVIETVDTESANEYCYMLFCYCVVIFLFIKSLAKLEHIRLLVLVIITACIGLCISAHFEGKFLSGRLNNIGPGDARGSNELGVLFAAIIPLMLPFIFKGKRYEKIICFLLLPLIINTFTLTVSRGALVALLSGLFYAFVFLSGKKYKKYFIGSAICILPLFLFLADEGYVERISSLWKTDVSSDEELNKLSAGRMDIWKHGFEMLNDYPLGVGPGGFRELSRFYMPENSLRFDPGRGYGVRAAHNSFLLVMVEQGYFGFCIFLIICFATMYSLYRSNKIMKQLGKDGDFIDLLVIALSMSVVSTLCGGMFNSRVYYEFFWWQIAISVVLSSLVKQLYKNEINRFQSMRESRSVI